MGSMGNEVIRFAVGSINKNLLYRHPEVKIVYGQDDFIYVSLFFSPYVFKFDTQGAYYGFLGWKPPYYREIKDDIPEGLLGSGEKERQALMERTRASTSTLGVHLLDEESLLVVYFNTFNITRNPDEEIGLIVMDVEGRRLMKEEILTSRKAWFYCARNGFAYGVRLPELDSLGHLLNPVIDVYRFIPSESL